MRAKRFYDTYAGDGKDWYLEICNYHSGAAIITINIKEAPRRWRREIITLSSVDALSLAEELRKSRT